MGWGKKELLLQKPLTLLQENVTDLLHKAADVLQKILDALYLKPWKSEDDLLREIRREPSLICKLLEPLCIH